MFHSALVNSLHKNGKVVSEIQCLVCILKPFSMLLIFPMILQLSSFQAAAIGVFLSFYLCMALSCLFCRKNKCWTKCSRFRICWRCDAHGVLCGHWGGLLKVSVPWKGNITIANRMEIKENDPDRMHCSSHSQAFPYSIPPACKGSQWCCWDVLVSIYNYIKMKRVDEILCGSYP